MTPADLRALAADHQHIRHHPHEVAAALLAAAELIEHGQRGVAELTAASASLRRWIHQSSYEMLDRFLRHNLNDDDYTEYSVALDELSFSPIEQRRPLTDEQIDALWKAPMSADWEHREFARAIEAAHGIGIKEAT